MRNDSLAFTTPAGGRRWQRWLIFSPPARIAIFTTVFLLLSTVLAIPVHAVMGRPVMLAPMTRTWLYLLTFVVPALSAYLFLVRVIERRVPGELALRGLLPWSIAGMLGGALLFSTVVAVLWLLGSYHVTGVNPDTDWLPSLLLVGLGAGIDEEILFRGVLFRVVEEGLGSWIALVFSALFFGVAHLRNPGATLWSSAAIAIEAGLLFGLLYHVTRSLYLCMGVHAAWNFMQGTVYGIPVSGIPADGWLISTRNGPDWLSGGTFGAEASVVALCVCSLCSVALLRVALRRGSIVPWGRREPMLTALLPSQTPQLTAGFDSAPRHRIQRKLFSDPR